MGIRIMMKDIRESRMKTKLWVSNRKEVKGWGLFSMLAWHLGVENVGSEAQLQADHFYTRAWPYLHTPHLPQTLFQEHPRLISRTLRSSVPLLVLFMKCSRLQSRKEAQNTGSQSYVKEALAWNCACQQFATWLCAKLSKMCQPPLKWELDNSS